MSSSLKKLLFVSYVLVLSTGCADINSESWQHEYPYNIPGVHCTSISGIHFQSNQASIDIDDVKYLCSLLADVNRPGFQVTSIEITGHSDNIENNKMTLSLERANNAAKYFIAHGVSPDIILTKGLGDTVPISENLTPEDREANRRVDIYFDGIWIDKGKRATSRRYMCEMIESCIQMSESFSTN